MGGVFSGRRVHASAMPASAVGAGGPGGPLTGLEPLPPSDSASETTLDNPGNLDEIHKKCKGNAWSSFSNPLTFIFNRTNMRNYAFYVQINLIVFA